MFAKLANNRKLEEATSAKDDVAPIYLLDEISELASVGGETAQGMADASIKRLGNRSPIVKQKALRLIKHVSGKGASEYRRAVCKQAKEIRDLTHYKGDPDPFKGDVLNQKVRDAAKETLDAIFQATDTNYNAGASKPTLTNRIQGFGSTNASDPVASSSYSRPSISSGGFSSTISNGGGGAGGGGMVGFGNPRFNNAKPSSGSNPSKWLPTNLANKLDSLNVLPKDRKGGLRHSEGNNGYSSEEDTHSVSTYSRPTIAQDTPSRTRSPLNSSTYNAASPSYRQGPGGGSGGGGLDEAQLVDDMCAPRGLRAQPDREDLRLFVENAASLNGPIVAQHLQSKLEAGSWQEVLRALCALEAVISQGSSAACGEIAVHFQANSTVVREAMKSPQASVRQCAMRVFKLLGGDTLPPATAASSQPAAAAQPDLMGNLLGEEEPASGSAAQPQQLLGDLLGDDTSAGAGPADLAGGMFAGLSFDNPTSSSSRQQQHPPPLTPAPAAAPQLSPMDALAGLQGPLQQAHSSTIGHRGLGAGASQPADDPFEGLSGPAASSSGQQGPSLFSGLQTGAGPASGSGQQGADMFGGLALQAPSPAPSATGLDSLMGFGSSNQAPAHSSTTPVGGASTADLFGGLSLDGSTASNPPQAPSPSAAAHELEGLFTLAQPSQQAASPQLQVPGPQLGQGHMGQNYMGQGMQPVNPAMAMLMMQMGRQPGAYQAVAPGMIPPGAFPPGMLPPGIIPPGMQGPPQYGQLGPGGMPSGAMPAQPMNPLQGLQGIPAAQMQYLSRQVGMQQPFPGSQVPQADHGRTGSADASGLDFPGGPSTPQGQTSPGGQNAKTDLLGRRLSSKTQNAFDFIGDHIRSGK